jgi:hypothetical protein
MLLIEHTIQLINIIVFILTGALTAPMRLTGQRFGCEKATTPAAHADLRR